MALPLTTYCSDWQFRQLVADRIGSASLATNATTGFMYVPACAGTPTGVPTGTPAGMVPIVYDSTNNLFYAYSNGAWRHP
jgi:hypothetical protein